MNKNLYAESMRRIGHLGLALMIVGAALSAILCVSNAADTMRMQRLGNPFGLMPILPFYSFLAGIGFAYMGFGFLNKRCDSDFYHSIPVRRLDMFLSVALASLTWIAATVVLCVLASMTVYLFMGVPFVPSYYLMGIPFFIVAAMLAFAAAAIACSLTGTLFSNMILTGVVLFLPRFVLFWLGRSIVANTWIVGWQDLAGLLNPCTNIATGMVVMLSRNMLKGDIVSMGNILYSLVLALVELALGALLFIRRPSELAERSAKNSGLQTLFACLLTLPVMLLFMRSPRLKTFVILLAASLIVYLAYQFIVLRSPKKVFASLVWYACTVAVAAGLYFGMAGISNAVLNETPAAADIQSVQFVRNEQSYYGQPSYVEVQVSKLRFTNNAVKECAADALQAAVARIKTPGYSGNRAYQDGYYSNNIESVVITLHNGRKLRRSIEFTDMNALNAARSENPDYAAAIQAFPAAEELGFLSGRYSNYKDISAEDLEKLRASFVAEYTDAGRVADSYYDKRVYQSDNEDASPRRMYTADQEQNLNNFNLAGHVGSKRFFNSYTIDLSVPKTAGLFMMLSNNNADADVIYNADATLKVLRDKAPEGGHFRADCSFTNVPMQDGSKQKINMNFYGNVYDGEFQAEKGYSLDIEMMEQLMEVLGRGMPTADPSGMFASFGYNSNVRFTGDANNNEMTTQSGYLAFTKEDEKLLLRIISQYTQMQADRWRVDDPDLTFIVVDAD